MGILIAIVVTTLVVAGVGAGIYVVMFRAKHKKEVMENSQIGGGNLPVYGVGSDQQMQPAQPQNLFDNAQAQPQPGMPASPLMNDITGTASQPSPMPDIPQAPETPQPFAQEATDVPAQPTVNHDFLGTSPDVQDPASDTPASAPEEPMAGSTLDLNQVGPDAGSAGNLLDDTETISPVAEMAANPTSTEVDSGIDDFTVPVTKESDSLEQVEEKVGEAEVNLGTEVRKEQNSIPETAMPTSNEAVSPPPVSAIQDFPTDDQLSVSQNDASMPAPEVPTGPEPIPTDVPPVEMPQVPEPPQAPQVENPPAKDNAGNTGQDAGTPEMNI